MPHLLVFAAVLLVAVLLSELADRSVLSMAVLFLVAGVAVASLSDGAGETEAVGTIAEIALFTVLFTDGMRVGIGALASAWRLPGRALLFGLPLTLGVTAVLAHFVANLSWIESFLVGAVLSPTDPVLVAAIVGREGVPRRLRHLLNVESGLNDGLALPVVIALLATLEHAGIDEFELGTELVVGVAIGVAIPWLAVKLEQLPFLSAAPGIAALFPFAIGLLIFALARATHGNLFLAAFAAGVTLQSVSPRFQAEFARFGQLLTELLKLSAVFVFGLVWSLEELASIAPSGYLFAALTLVLARPLALGIALFGSDIDTREWMAAAWFGPKGFASIVYGLLIAHSTAPSATEMFHLIALVVAASIVVHSSTDVLIARRLSAR